MRVGAEGHSADLAFQELQRALQRTEAGKWRSLGAQKLEVNQASQG